MNKLEAKNLIVNTFEKPFNEAQFTYFIKNLLNNVDESKNKIYRGNIIPESYDDAISIYKRIGQYKDAKSNVIDILTVKLKKETSLDRARSKQRNFIARYLKQHTHDAALVAYYTDGNNDWRFSLVKMDIILNDKKIETDFTPARRYSFLVGTNEGSHTAQNQFVKLLTEKEENPTLDKIEDAFNIETVTKEFFLKYRDLFIRIKQSLDKVIKNDSTLEVEFKSKEINSVDFAKKLLGQIVFLYFLQKKGWFGVEKNSKWGSGSKKFLREIYKKKHGIYDNFFNDILEPLFYEALRNDRTHDDHYYSRFNCKIPFLNGGLFDPIGNYDWSKTDIILPNDLFSNTHQTKEGDTGDGILDVFDRYNFTVIEDEPLEKEVAIDPELLGKAYEKFNAIRPDNFDEYLKALKSGKKGDEAKFNKQYGVFYTPREIVHFMCQQSLINYLVTELDGKVSKESIEFLILEGEKFVEHLRTAKEKNEKNEDYTGKYKQNNHFLKLKEYANEIDNLLANLKMCDPAVGSGAFPVGMMSEIVKARMFFVLTNCLDDKYINPHNQLVPSGKVKRNPYNFKRNCIENSLYGVDIDAGAVEIAKLRLWLSLVVDEDDINNIKPLPNLDYKIVCGNSLLGVEKNIFNNEYFEQLEKLKPLYFNETNPTKKQDYKKQIDELILKISNGHKDFDFEVYFSEVFHHKGGFDILIGNPPFVEHKKLKAFREEIKNQIYATHSGSADLYVYFYERSIQLLKPKGILAFISSNKFFKTNYGALLRDYLSQLQTISIVDFTDYHVFDALVASCVYLLRKVKRSNEFIFVDIKEDFQDQNVYSYLEENKTLYPSSLLKEKYWQFDELVNYSLKSNIEKIGKQINSIHSIIVNRGVTTGSNEIFIISSKMKNEIILKDSRSLEIIKPVLQGRNIRKWYYELSDNHLIFTRKGIDIEKYPAVLDYLSLYHTELEPGIGRKPGDYNWYEIQDNTAYYQNFEKEKIIWGLTADKWAFAYDDKKHFLPSNGYILTSAEINLKYILGVLNSNLMQFYFRFIGIMTAGGAYTLKHQTINELPLKIPTSFEENIISTLVDYHYQPTKTKS